MRRASALFWLVLLVAPATLAGVRNHEPETHRFVMPGSPAKTIPAPTPWLTGEELLRRLDPPLDIAKRQSIIDEAVKYLMGVYDATESGVWCYTDSRPRPTPKQAPDVMRSATITYLRKLPAQARQGKAAALIVQMWQQDWPCPPTGCCPGLGYN